MARPLRLEFEGAVYHLTGRGNARQNIFLDPMDFGIFLEILSQTISRYGWICHAYCLMDNHYHLLIETPKANLSLGMRHINGSYTQKFNRRHKRVGHVFQGRFKAILVEKGSHLLELSRYVVLNPVRARMVQKAEDWKWSSYSATGWGGRKAECLTEEWILSQFDKKKGEARRKYREFVRAGLKQSKDEAPWERLVGQIYFGSERFIQGLKGKRKKGQEEIPLSQRIPVKRTLVELLKSGNDDEIVRAYKEGYRLREIGRHLGIHYTTVSVRLKRGEKGQN